MSEDRATEPTGAEDDVEPTTHRRKRGTGFPVVDLSEAARILKEAGKYGFEHPASAFASYMGHSSTNSGSFRQRLAAFRDWELITGRGESLAMTEVARMIAMPTDTDAELKALQQAFENCDVFLRMYKQTAKGQPLDQSRLGGRAVHELGVAPAKASKFAESFVESAVVAQLAEIDEEGKVVLWGPTIEPPDGETEISSSDAVTSEPIQTETSTTAQAQPRPTTSSSTPTIRQSWPIAGGTILFELHSDEALPASAFGQIGEVVSRLESLADALAPAPDDSGTQEVES